MNIYADLRLEGELDLHLQGFIALEGAGTRKASRIQYPSPQLAADPDAADGKRDGIAPSETRRIQASAQPRCAVNRAATKARRALEAVKEAVKRNDDQRIRQETEHLKEAAVRLSEAVQRASAYEAAQRASSLQIPEFADAEIEEPDKSDLSVKPEHR
jgi:hypothetical protein